MKYFTMEELDYIAKELIENPSKETLKRLNSQYNGEEATTKDLNWVESPVVENEIKGSEPSDVENNSPMVDISPVNNFYVPINQNSVAQDETEKNEEQVGPQLAEELIPKTPVWNPPVDTNNTLFNQTTNSSNTEALNVPQMPDLSVNETQQNSGIPNFELPKVEDASNVNNSVPFSGNLWERPNTEINNMMQTTDNFNVPIEQPTSNKETQVEQMPFFQPDLNPINNTIPVSEPQFTGPTMFGQFEQDYNNKAA